MRIIRTNDFDFSLEKLPKEIARLLANREERFKINWRDARLHIKKVRSFNGVFSLRITRRYRAFFYFQNKETVIFFDIDHRKDVY